MTTAEPRDDHARLTRPQARPLSTVPPTTIRGDIQEPLSAEHQPSRRRRASLPPVPLLGLGSLGAALVILPVVCLLAKAPYSHLFTLLSAGPARSALWLSLVCSLSATALCVLLGVPLAWIQQRTTFPGRRLLRALTTLPVVLPPVVGGVGLLLAFGRRGLLGQFLAATLGIQVAFSLTGVIIAETFVSNALPRPGH